MSQNVSGVESDKTMIAANIKGPGAGHRKKNQFYKLKLSQHNDDNNVELDISSNSASPVEGSIVSTGKIKNAQSMKDLRTQEKR